MSRLDRDPRSRKSPMNRRQRYRDVMREDKRNADLRSLRMTRFCVVVGFSWVTTHR